MSISSKVLGLGLLALVSTSGFSAQWIFDRQQRVEFTFTHAENLINEHPKKGDAVLQVSVGSTSPFLHGAVSTDSQMTLTGSSKDHMIGTWGVFPSLAGNYPLVIKCVGVDGEFKGQMVPALTQTLTIAKDTKVVNITAECPSKGTLLAAPENIVVDVKK